MHLRMIAARLPTRLRHTPLLVLLAMVLATWINFHPYELFLGASLIFGMSLAFATLFLARGWWGMIVAIPACMATVAMWGQPYSALIFILEIVTLSVIRNSSQGSMLMLKGHIIIVDFLFWLTAGGSLYYLSHRFLMGLSPSDALAIAQKAVLNGVVNVLIGYIIYAVIALARNHRSAEKPTISIQALSLAIIYSLTVLVALLTTNRLYVNVVEMQAKALRSSIIEQAQYVMEALGPTTPTEDHQFIQEYMKRRDLVFRWSHNQAITQSADTTLFDTIYESYIDSSKKTLISLKLLGLLDSPHLIRLWMPMPSREAMLLKRFEKGYWLAEIQSGDESLSILRSAKEEFYELTDFYTGALQSITYILLIGIGLSFAVSLKLGQEFSAVLGRSRATGQQPESTDDLCLILSPIREIQELVVQVNVKTAIIQESRIQIEELNRIAQQQLSTAGEIQQCFLGSSLHKKDGLDISLFMRPAYNAGGDWYDTFEIDGKTFVVVADVCDKGVGAALFMSVFRSLIRYSAESICREDKNDQEPLDKVLASVNDYMSTEHAETAMFATVFLACIYEESCRIDYILAGHEEPLLMNRNGKPYKFNISGPAIGLFPFAEYKIGSIYYEEGSLLMGYTDGVVDARDHDNHPFGHSRLVAFIQSLRSSQPQASAEAITQALIDELDRHMGGADQFDDITVATVILG